MKTLDEVIKSYEYCDHGELDSRCEDCPYNGIGVCCAERESDALHYLKEYRTTQTAYIKAMADIEDNPPLTWDELRTMEGKPVWVEGTSLKSAWYLILDFDVDNDMMLCVGRYYERIPLHCDRLGIYWQSYRKERE